MRRAAASAAKGPAKQQSAAQEAALMTWQDLHDVMQMVAA